MAQAPTDIQDHGARDLDDQVGQLIAELEPERQGSAEETPQRDDGGGGAPDALGDGGAPATEAGAATPPGAGALDEGVDQMIAEASAPATTIEELDEQLAQTADDAAALAGDFVPLEEVVDEPAPAAAAAAPGAPPADDVGAAPERGAPAPEAPATVDETASEEGAPGALAVVTKVADLASRPFALRSARIRQLAGWAGLNMVFLAACVWAYLLIRPAPGAATASAHAPAGAHADSGHGKADKGHAPAPKKADHGGASKKAAPKKSAGGGH